MGQVVGVRVGAVLYPGKQASNVVVDATVSGGGGGPSACGDPPVAGERLVQEPQDVGVVAALEESYGDGGGVVWVFEDAGVLVG